jgi:branched-chain amino acid transport system substrate-binding protein
MDKVSLRSARRGSLAVAVLLIWCAGLASATPGPAALRIGYILSLSGVFAPASRDMLNGWELFWESVGYSVRGRRVEVIVEDDGGVPAVTLTKARKLVEHDGVRILVGPFVAAAGYALADYAAEKRILHVYPHFGGDDLTQRRPRAYTVRLGSATSQVTHPMGEWLVRFTPYRRVATIGFDTVFAYEAIGGFHRAFEDSGGRVVQKLWPPIGAADYAPYFSRLRPDVEAVFAVFTGGDALRFVQQYAEFGLKTRLPLFGIGNLTDESVLVGMGEEAVGVVTVLHYSAALQNESNRVFGANYAKKYRRPPSYFAENSYTTARILYRVLAERDEDGSSERLIASLRRVKIDDAPRGPVEMDAYGNPVHNVYVRRVERRGGILQNTVIYTFPRVSQFWKYDAQVLLQQPAYSRDYPPCRYCGP